MMPNDEKDINIYASLSDEKDKQYVEEYRSEGVDIQIDVKVTGIYKLAFYLPTNQENRKKQTIKLMVGGRYNISIDKNTYAVDLELLNVDTAHYVVEVYADDTLQELEPVSVSTSCLYEFNYTASKNMAFAPYFYDAALKKITFTNLNTTLLIAGVEFVMFKKAGSYKLIINMRDYSIDAVQLD